MSMLSVLGAQHARRHVHEQAQDVDVRHGFQVLAAPSPHLSSAAVSSTCRARWANVAGSGGTTRAQRPAGQRGSTASLAFMIAVNTSVGRLATYSVAATGPPPSPVSCSWRPYSRGFHALGLVDPRVDSQVRLLDRFLVRLAVASNVHDLVDLPVGSLVRCNFVQLHELGMVAQPREHRGLLRHAGALADAAQRPAVRDGSAKPGGEFGGR